MSNAFDVLSSEIKDYLFYQCMYFQCPSHSFFTSVGFAKASWFDKKRTDRPFNRAVGQKGPWKTRLPKLVAGKASKHHGKGTPPNK